MMMTNARVMAVREDVLERDAGNGENNVHYNRHTHILYPLELKMNNNINNNKNSKQMLLFSLSYIFSMYIFGVDTVQCQNTMYTN